MSKSTWTGTVSSDWADADNWSPAVVPGASSAVTIASGRAVASASIGTVNSITDSYALAFESAGTNTVATFLDDTGHLKVDANGGEGGTILNIVGTLTNSGHLHIGNATLSASDEVTAAALNNTGKVYLRGFHANQALLEVTSRAGFGAAGVLNGSVALSGDSAIEFASGAITSLAAEAQLSLNGNDAFIEDSTALGSNSALTRLASIGSEARLLLGDGASVSTTGALTNSGFLEVYSADASLSVAKGLTNSGSLDVENYGVASSPSVNSVTAGSFVNSGTVILSGNTNNSATLNVSGALTNNGSISITDDIEELAGAVGGTGSFTLYGAKLQFELECLVRSDHRRLTNRPRGYAHPHTGAEFRSHAQRFRHRRQNRRNEPCRDRNEIQFRGEYGGHGRHAHPDRHESESDRRYPDDRPLFQFEFHPRPRQRDGHAGANRPSRRRRSPCPICFSP